MRSKNKASSLLWPDVRIYHADPDDRPDTVESEDGDPDIVNSIIADESFYAEEPEKRARETFGRNTPISADIEISIQPVLDPINAKDYAHSAAPTHRGSRERVCRSILDTSRRVLV